jgi:hypothetical protein
LRRDCTGRSRKVRSPVNSTHQARCGRSPRQREAHCERPLAAAAGHANLAPHVRLGHAPGDELRRPVRTEPGRPHQLQADDGRLRAAARSQQAHTARPLTPCSQTPKRRSTGRGPANLAHYWPTKRFWPLGRSIPRHPSLALTLGNRTMGAAGFEPATSRV